MENRKDFSDKRETIADNKTLNKVSENSESIPERAAETPSFMDIGLGKDVLGNDDPEMARKDMEEKRTNSEQG